MGLRPTQGGEKTPRSSSHSLWNRCPFLCHPACPGMPWDRSVAERRDLQFSFPFTPMKGRLEGYGLQPVQNPSTTNPASAAEGTPPLRRSNRKHTPQPSKLEQFPNPRADPSNTQPNPLTLAPDIMASQHPKPGRIHIRNLRQIKQMGRGLFLPRSRFKNTAKRIRRQGVIHIPPSKRPKKSKHHAMRFVLSAFDRKSRTLPNLSFNHRKHFPFPIPLEQPRIPEQSPGWIIISSQTNPNPMNQSPLASEGCPMSRV
jgi:hypothetical protein